MSFHQLFEDPMYDEDGNCIDEDFEFDEQEPENYDPFETVNS